MRAPPQALAVARHLSDTGYQFPPDFCLGACKTYFEAIRNGGSAASNWAQCPDAFKHYSWPPPPGYLPVWLGGGSGFGHIVISAGGGMCYSTDFTEGGFVGDGLVHLIHINSISANDRNLHYAGWMNWLHDPLPAPLAQREWFVRDRRSGIEVGRGPAPADHSFILGRRAPGGELQWYVYDTKIKDVVGYRRMNPGRQVALGFRERAA